MYEIPFGPVPDGIMVPLNPIEKMKNSLKKYEVLLGMTQSESYHMFVENTINNGLSDRKQRDILFKYLSNEYQSNTSLILDRVLNEYTHFRQMTNNDMSNRNVILEVFSDAWVVAPMISTARVLCDKATKPVFMYVFEHKTRNGYYPGVLTSIHGEDLPFLLGQPLTGGSNQYQLSYTDQEVLLSEVMMNYLLNFVKFG